MVEKQLNDALNRAARMGQRGDTEVGHLTPREVVIPIAVQKRFPEAMRALRGMFTEAGLNYEQYVVGNKANKIHARTGKPQFFEGNDSGGYGEGGGGTSDNGGGGGGGGRAGPEGAIDPSENGRMSDTSYGGPGPGRSVGEMNANDAVNAARTETQDLSVEALDAKLAATLENAIQAGVVSPNTTVSTPATSTPATSTPSTSTPATSTPSTSTPASPNAVAPETSPTTSTPVAETEAEVQALENAMGMVANNPATTVASPTVDVAETEAETQALENSLGMVTNNPSTPETTISEPGSSGDSTVIPTAEVVSPSTTTTTTPTTPKITPVSYAVDNFLSNLGKTTMVQAPNVYTPFPVTQGIGSFKPYNISIPLPTFSKVPGQL